MIRELAAFSRLAGITLALVIVAACGESSTDGSASATQSAPVSPAATTGQLDPAVGMPAGFPADVPIYPGARLTKHSYITSNGIQAWNMVWETLDGTERVQAYYGPQLDKGDWSTVFSGTAGIAFNRRSDHRVHGILSVDRSSGVTRITLALTKSA